MYWYEIGCHAVTFFQCNFLNIPFDKAMHIYHKKIHSKFHKDLLRGWGDMGGTKSQRNGTRYFIYRINVIKCN